MIFHFFGPSNNYLGLFGIEWQTNARAYTLHIFPRFTGWGYSEEDEIKIYSLGCFLELDWSDANQCSNLRE